MYRKMLIMSIMFSTLLFASSPLVAEVAGSVVPGVGNMLQQIAPLTPPASSPRGAGQPIARVDSAKLPQSAPFLVNRFQITGNTLFDTATLHALVAEAQGQSITLTQLGELAARITSYYQNNHYPLARAIIPAQTIVAGVVRIKVIEASYGKISLDNRSRVKDALLQATLAPLQSGQVIEETELDHAFRLVSNIPGVVLDTTFKAGEGVGTSDLLVSTTPGPTITGNMIMNNYGSRYTGMANIMGTVNIINPLRHGDVLSVNGLSSGRKMNYASLSYETYLNGQGARLGGAYSVLSYALGEPLEAVNGNSRVASLWATHPLLLSRDVNLYARLQFDRLQLRDHIDDTGIKTDRSLDNLELSLTGDARDEFLSGGINTWSLGWTVGRVSFDNADAQVTDAATAGTQGRYSKWNASLTRLQRLSPKSDLYLAFNGQWANGNLDASQKMSVGGPSSVRAYGHSALVGDTVYIATAELRHALGAAWGGRWSAVAFVDVAHVTVNQKTWVAGTNSTTLSGAGVGVSWAGPEQWLVKASLATSTGAVSTLVAGNASSRVWFEISKGF
jgi:hemolysin activation/secretion protein